MHPCGLTAYPVSRPEEAGPLSKCWQVTLTLAIASTRALVAGIATVRRLGAHEWRSAPSSEAGMLRAR
jgi:hypothetical protein